MKYVKLDFFLLSFPLVSQFLSQICFLKLHPNEKLCIIYNICVLKDRLTS